MCSLRVALFSDEFPPYVHGGAGTFCYHLAYWLSKKRVFTTVFTGRSRRLARETVNDRLEVVRLPFFDFPPRFFWFQLQNFRSISRRLQDFTVIHAITPEVSPICVYLKKKFNKPLVTSYHGYTVYEMKASISSPFSSWTIEDVGYHVLEYPFFAAGNRLSAGSSDHVTSCSYAALDELKSIYKNLDPRKSSVIYNGIDLDEINILKEKCARRENPNDFTIIYYGRLLWLKGITFLVESFKLLLEDYPNATLKVYGNGPLEHRVRSLASHSSLKGRVQILGKIPRNELLMEIMQADIVVLPSMREAQPMAVLEAMACKKPIVVFDMPFAREYIVDSVNGLLAKAKDSRDLADKISTLLSSKKLRDELGQNAYEYVKQNHNWDNLIDKYIVVYKKVTQSS